MTLQFRSPPKTKRGHRLSSARTPYHTPRLWRKATRRLRRLIIVPANRGGQDERFCTSRGWPAPSARSALFQRYPQIVAGHLFRFFDFQHSQDRGRNIAQRASGLEGELLAVL